MGVFEFVIILVIITTLGKVAISVGRPLVDRLGDIAGELAASKRAERERTSQPRLDPDVVDEIERRLARIEDRLDFLEELKAPEKPRALGGDHGLDRAGGPRGVTEPGRQRSETDDPTVGGP